MSFTLADHQYMAEAIKLAKKGHYTTSPNPRVGCVIVRDGEVVGRGFHKKAGEGHAEVHALKAAGEKAKGAIAYVTLEPCSHFGRTPPCSQALINAGVSKVIAAMVDPNPQVSGRGLKMLADAGVEVSSGLLEQGAKALNPGFIKLMETKRPYVRVKLASSLDGKTAMASGESKWITGPLARQDVQRLRAQSCTIIAGADSVIIDGAKMNVRHQELGELKDKYIESDLRQPVRVVIDTKNRLTPHLPFFSVESPVIIIRTALENTHQWPHFVEQVVVAEHMSGQNKFADLSDVLTQLAKRGLNDVLVESGAKLAGAFIEQNLVDELVLYQAPMILGSDGKSLADMPSVSQLAESKKLVIKDLRQVGQDMRITALFSESN